MPTVDILMATYNGEKYIESQILSIIAQSYKDWNLIIHDDGSVDKTVEIIKKWSSIDKRISLIQDGVVLRNAAKNFMHLLRYSSSEYIMFCDQDDIWLDNKVNLMYDEIVKHRSNIIPVVVYSNSYLWLPGKGIIGMSTLAFAGTLQSFLFLNSGIQGCAAIFNSKAKDYMIKWDGDLAMHDHLLQLVCVTFGKVFYLPHSLMFYRQHENNVTGVMDRQSIININNVFKNKKIPVIECHHYETIRKFFLYYHNEMNHEQKGLFSVYLNFPKVGRVRRIYSVLKYKFKIFNSIALLAFKVLLRPAI